MTWGGWLRSQGPRAGPARRDGNIFDLTGPALPRPRTAPPGPTKSLYCGRAVMRAIILGVLAAGLTAVTAGGGAKKDTERLQGSWTGLHMEEAGNKVPDEIIKAMA